VTSGMRHAARACVRCAVRKPYGAVSVSPVSVRVSETWVTPTYQVALYHALYGRAIFSLRTPLTPLTKRQASPCSSTKLGSPCDH